MAALAQVNMSSLNFYRPKIACSGLSDQNAVLIPLLDAPNGFHRVPQMPGIDCTIKPDRVASQSAESWIA